MQLNPSVYLLGCKIPMVAIEGGWYQCSLCRKRSLYYKGLFFLCKLIPILYGSFLCKLMPILYGSFLCTEFPILYGSFLCTKPPIYGSILCMTPPILHKIVPLYGVSYMLLWVHLMYTDYCGSYSCT